MTNQKTHEWSVGCPEFMMLIEDDPSAADVVDSILYGEERKEMHHLELSMTIAEALASSGLCPMDWLERIVATSVATHYYLTTNTPCPFEDVNIERSLIFPRSPTGKETALLRRGSSRRSSPMDAWSSSGSSRIPTSLDGGEDSLAFKERSGWACFLGRLRMMPATTLSAVFRICDSRASREPRARPRSF